jgi:hypothetical protein
VQGEPLSDSQRLPQRLRVKVCTALLLVFCVRIGAILEQTIDKSSPVRPKRSALKLTTRNIEEHDHLITAFNYSQGDTISTGLAFPGNKRVIFVLRKY